MSIQIKYRNPCWAGSLCQKSRVSHWNGLAIYYQWGGIPSSCTTPPPLPHSHDALVYPCVTVHMNKNFQKINEPFTDALKIKGISLQGIKLQATMERNQERRIEESKQNKKKDEEELVQTKGIRSFRT